MNPNLIAIRPMTKEDESFVYSSWLRSYRNSPIASLMSNDVYFGNHKLIIEKLLNKANTNILCDPADPTHIFGFLCSEETLVHYIYIKYSYRKMGLAKHLLNSIHSDLTSMTVTHYSSKLNTSIEFNPYLLNGDK